ncbi:aminotransferase-like domain-containing protein [Desulforhopalus sp. 52FAK]
MWKATDINLRSPKYLSIADALESDISAGNVLAGEQLPPQRELADQLSVNLSTVSRAYRVAENRGLISGIVGKGTFVSTDVSINPEMIPIEKHNLKQIELGVVSPLHSLDPDLQPRLIKLSTNHDLASYARYTEPSGLSQHLQIGAEWASRFSLSMRPDLVVVTAGAQHALTCTFIACFRPESRIAVDCLSYPGLKALASMMNIRLVPINMDENGMIPDSLNSACNSHPIEGIYLMPSCHNPTGITMGERRRIEIIELIKKHRLLLIEDDAYYFTSENPQPALSSFIPDNSIFIANFSKILFAGLRSAFVFSSPKIREQLIRAVLNTIWMAPSLNTAILCDVIEDGTIDQVIKAKLKEAKSRNSIVGSTLPFQYPLPPTQKFYQWYQLPKPWSAAQFETYALRRGVNIFCGEKFGVGNQAIGQYVRLAITSPETRQDLSVGLAILKDILQIGHLDVDGIN